MKKRKRTVSAADVQRAREREARAKSERDALLDAIGASGNLMRAVVLAYARLHDEAHPLVGYGYDRPSGGGSRSEAPAPGSGTEKARMRLRRVERDLRRVIETCLTDDSDRRRIRGLWCQSCRKHGRVTAKFCDSCGDTLVERNPK